MSFRQIAKKTLLIRRKDNLFPTFAVNINLMLTMEKLLHYVWKHKIFPLQPLRTTAGQRVEVIDPGLPNRNAGPDFFNAKLKIDGTLWAGNVEIHALASDWFRHGHSADKAYDSVILHVVGEDDGEVLRADGSVMPQLVLTCPDEVRARYDELLAFDKRPPCQQILPALSKLTVHAWFSALQAERLEQKTEAITHRLSLCNQDWEAAFFVTLARNFGFGLNGDVFEAWALRVPLRAVDKHRDQLFQVEAIFFGQAGLLDEALDDAYYRQLQHEYRYLQHKFELPAPLPVEQWRMLRLRPYNFPYLRLAQLASLYQQRPSLFSQLMEAETPEAAKKLLTVVPSVYWEEHYSFHKASTRSRKQVGQGTLDLLLINTVVPFLYAYGRHKMNETLCNRALYFLETLKAEHNHITRFWENSGLPVPLATAADSQALIQLQKEYCDKKECLRCRFGYEYLKGH